MEAFYIKPEEKAEINSIIKDNDINEALRLFLECFNKLSINNPALNLSDDGVIKMTFLLKENTNNTDIFHFAKTKVQYFNNAHTNQQIELINKDDIINFFVGTICIKDKVLVRFNIASPSLLLYDLLTEMNF